MDSGGCPPGKTLEAGRTFAAMWRSNFLEDGTIVGGLKHFFDTKNSVLFYIYTVVKTSLLSGLVVMDKKGRDRLNPLPRDKGWTVPGGRVSWNGGGEIKRTEQRQERQTKNHVDS